MNSAVATEQKALELFEVFADLDPSIRRKHLIAATEGDNILRQYVLALESHCTESETQLQHLQFVTQHTSMQDRFGQIIGRYKLLESLGQGSMGQVYLAERVDGNYEKKVAIKLTHFDFDNKYLAERFYHERHILAGLEHPNIARMLDAGQTDDGFPYYVMEFIDGVPIDQYCDLNKLSCVEIIRLFSQVCEVVNYAHQNLIIHRDLKPANILVDQDNKIKLLDFGIAKLLRQENESLELTQPGMQPMTPSYASPEQLLGKPLTTASDIYSLGVLLYRLLTQLSLFGKDGSTSKHLENILKENVPSKPSKIIDRDKLKSVTGSDIDNILFKALALKPEQRYDSAKLFSDDLQRMLAFQPVQARTATLSYRTKRFIQRNRLSVSATLIVFLSFFFLAQKTFFDNQLLRKERLKSENALEFIVDLFNASDPEVVPGNTITAKEVLDQGVEKINGDYFKDQPALKSDLLLKMGIIYRKLGIYVQAQALLAESISLRKQYESSSQLTIAESLYEAGVLYRYIGEVEQAEEYFFGALEIYRKKYGDESRSMLINNLGSLYFELEELQATSTDYYNQASVNGKWYSACEGMGRTGTTEIVNHRMIIEYTVYTEPRCAGFIWGKLRYENTLNYRFRWGGLEGYTYDSTIESIELTLTAEAVPIANATNHYGHEDWAPGAPQQVSGFSGRGNVGHIGDRLHGVLKPEGDVLNIAKAKIDESFPTKFDIQYFREPQADAMDSTTYDKNHF